MLQGAAGQFFCEDEDTSATSSSGADDECVFRDDTLVLLEMTTRDMMEARRSHGGLLAKYCTTSHQACDGVELAGC